MNDNLPRIKALIAKRAVELAHYKGMEFLATGLIETRRQIDAIQRIPPPGPESVALERAREEYMNMARIIENQEIPALIDLLEKTINERCR